MNSIAFDGMIILCQMDMEHFVKQYLCQFRLGISDEFVVKRPFKGGVKKLYAVY